MYHRKDPRKKFQQKINLFDSVGSSHDKTICTYICLYTCLRTRLLVLSKYLISNTFYSLKSSFDHWKILISYSFSCFYFFYINLTADEKFLTFGVPHVDLNGDFVCSFVWKSTNNVLFTMEKSWWQSNPSRESCSYSVILFPTNSMGAFTETCNKITSVSQFLFWIIRQHVHLTNCLKLFIYLINTIYVIIKIRL